jgi:hypothetical protein
LRERHNEKEMWEVIQGIWEVLKGTSFSSSRCRGYLHAKAFAKGGEFHSCYHARMAAWGWRGCRGRSSFQRLVRSPPARFHLLP